MKTKIYISLILIVVCFNSCKRTNCHNGVQDGDETGIDCGGSCLQCPPSVSTSPPSGITLTTANVSMQYSSNNTSFNSIGIYYGTTHNPSSLAVYNYGQFNSSGDFTGLITGLTPSTTYYVRGFARDNNAIAYGNEISFTTNSVAPVLPTITTTSATAVTLTTAVSGGNITSDGGSAVTARGICYSTTSNPTTANTVVTGGAGIGSFSSSITGLTTLTTYYIRAFATNSVGTAYGNQVSVTPSPAPTIPTLTTTVVTSIALTSATSGGNISSDGGASVTSRGICYSTSPSPTTASSLVSGGTGIGSFISNMTGLTSGSTYYVRAYATNSVGTAYGNQVSFTAIGIGQTYQGGIVFYIDGSGLHGLIACPNNLNPGATISWYNGVYMVTGATSSVIGTGQSNTTTIITAQGNTGSYAAKICQDLVLGGYSDWYLPSKNEAITMATNISAATWTSTEGSSTTAYIVYVDSSFSLNNKNYSSVAIRAIRSF